MRFDAFNADGTSLGCGINPRNEHGLFDLQMLTRIDGAYILPSADQRTDAEVEAGDIVREYKRGRIDAADAVLQLSAVPRECDADRVALKAAIFAVYILHNSRS